VSHVSRLGLPYHQIAVTQSLSGTGALRIGGAFIARHYPHSKTIYLPVPSWGNHTPIFRDSGLEVRGYRYFDKATVGLDFKGLQEDLRVRILWICRFMRD
jgi:aspartate aminotransferase